jgi:hypothetical protein
MRGGGGAAGGHDPGAQSTYFPRDETGSVCQPTQLERTLQLWGGPGGGGGFQGPRCTVNTKFHVYIGIFPKKIIVSKSGSLITGKKKTIEPGTEQSIECCRSMTFWFGSACGTGRPKNIRILRNRMRIRIRNTIST